MDINSLPHVSDSAMQAMQKNADKMMQEAGVIVPHPEINPVAKMSTTQPRGQVTPEPEQTYSVSQPTQHPNWQLQTQVEQEPQSDSNSEEHDHDHEEEVQEEIAPVQTPPAMAHRKTPAESFSELKAAKERIERENQELMRKLIERENFNQQAQKQQMKIEQPTQEDLDFNVNDDDLVDGKVANKIKKSFKQQQQELRDYKQQIENIVTESKLKAQFSDFDKVVSKDNIDLLSYTYPELANSLNSNPDLYSKAVSAYTMIKNLGIHKEEIPMTPERKRMQENANKPRLSPAAISTQSGDTPLSKANMFSEGLTPQLQEQLRREMSQSRRGY
jgi:hypothetical protein